MERLTNKNLTKACNDPWDYCGMDSVCTRDCHKPTPCKIPKIVHRLAEIEDILGPVYDLARIRELVEADRDGQCVVLPCKFGDPVYRIYDDCTLPGDCYTKQKCRGCEYRNIFIEEQEFCLSMLSQNGKMRHPYYTSKEAAEAALRDQNGGTV